MLFHIKDIDLSDEWKENILDELTVYETQCRVYDKSSFLLNKDNKFDFFCMYICINI